MLEVGFGELVNITKFVICRIYVRFCFNRFEFAVIGESEIRFEAVFGVIRRIFIVRRLRKVHRLSCRRVQVSNYVFVEHTACAEEQEVLCKRKVEHQEQNHKEDRDTPDLVGEHLVRFVGYAEFFFFVFLFLRYDGRIVLDIYL